MVIGIVYTFNQKKFTTIKMAFSCKLLTCIEKSWPSVFLFCFTRKEIFRKRVLKKKICKRVVKTL